MNPWTLTKGALALMFIAAPASAEEVSVYQDRNVPYRIVAYDDLSLDTRAGIAALNARVDMAVKRLCRPNRLMWDRARCADQAWAGARPQIEEAIAGGQLASAGMADTVGSAILIVAP